MIKPLLYIAGCLLLCTALSFNLKAQELDAEVRISTPQLQRTDPKVFEELESAIRDFLNNEAFSKVPYEPEERIKCNFQMTIKEEQENNTFTADLAVQATRPVYGSDYETVLLSHVDKDVRFVYSQSQPIEYRQNAYVDNLSSILSFYALVIIGLDYDSFEALSGERFYVEAQQVVNVVPPSEASKYRGWQSLDGNRNRFWITENLLNPRVTELRRAFYHYHLNGLDIMYLNSEQGQHEIVEALQKVLAVNGSYPNSMIVPMFVNAKSSEIMEIMAKAPRNLQRQAYSIMSNIDPSNASKYEKLR